MATGFVLVVEDNDKLARMYDKVLRHAGFDTLTTPSVQEAMDVFLEYQPDVVLLDWRLIDGTSAPFLAYIQDLNLEKLPRIMVISAEVRKTDLEAYLDVIYDYFAKPMSPKEMVDRIQR